MAKILAGLLLAAALCGKAWCVDEFQGVRCGTDISRSLIGRRSADRPVFATQMLHRDIGLRNLGGEEISDQLFLVSWRICGAEYKLLLDTGSETIRDVLRVPERSRRSPQTMGPCQVKNRELKGPVMAVLDNSAGYDPGRAQLARTLLRARVAWRIDSVRERFVALPVDNLACRLGGVAAEDGGQ